MQSDKLPKMPEPRYCAADYGYTDLQMYSYALAARKSALQEVRVQLGLMGAGEDSSLVDNYAAGGLDGMRTMDSWVERLMEQDA